MQQEPEDTKKLEALLESIREDVEALKAGGHGAHKRLLEKSAQFQFAVETPAETTFRMRFSVGLRQFFPNVEFWKFSLSSLCDSSSNKLRFASSLRMAFYQLYVQKEILILPLNSCRRTRA